MRITVSVFQDVQEVVSGVIRTVTSYIGLMWSISNVLWRLVIGMSLRQLYLARYRIRSGLREHLRTILRQSKDDVYSQLSARVSPARSDNSDSSN